jgi:hypothetical protein
MDPLSQIYDYFLTRLLFYLLILCEVDNELLLSRVVTRTLPTAKLRDTS